MLFLVVVVCCVVVVFACKAYGDFRKMCRGLTAHRQQLLLMFLSLCQLMARGLLGKCSDFCTKYCKGEISQTAIKFKKNK